MNLARHVARNAKAYPDAPALAVGPRVVATWREMETHVARLAGGLRMTLGLAPGECVALIMRNCPEYAEVLYACWHAGLTAVPINAKLHPKELAFIVDHSQARVVFATPDLAQAVNEAVADAGARARVIVIGTPEHRALAGADPIAIARVEPDDLAWLFYTSGTTGRPKGAMLSHRNELAMTTSYFIDIDPAQPGGAIVHAAPMSHGSGVYMIPSVAQGNCQVIPESDHFDAGEVLGLLDHWRHVSMFAAPTMINRMAQHPRAASAKLENLRVVVWGGAPMYVADLEAAIAKFGYRFAQLYGQGESPMTITGMTRALVEDAHRRRDMDRLASAGLPQTVVEVKVADAEDRELPVGEVGEILVRGDSVMRGYWRNEKASAETLRGGWLHTGDLGSFDASGYLTLRDRSKDMVISGGSNIYPREIEEVLLRHPDVAEASVIGVPDPQWGEAVVAYVVARPGATLDIKALDALCLDNIARFKRPKAYREIDALPKSAYGKILKTELRARYAKESG
ncbi:MAG: long-chain fatty acid--CoA ligase [Alphaproteobacteria bacterium]|nr:long-chain fatty acid--CoA ligase [Alphaproteobacteria bacterium]